MNKYILKHVTESFSSKNYLDVGVLGGGPLGEGVESDGVRARGNPPPPLLQGVLI